MVASSTHPPRGSSKHTASDVPLSLRLRTPSSFSRTALSVSERASMGRCCWILVSVDSGRVWRTMRRCEVAEDFRAMARRFNDEVMSQGKLEVIDELVAEDF